jgi:hypothetical protein
VPSFVTTGTPIRIQLNSGAFVGALVSGVSGGTVSYSPSLSGAAAGGNNVYFGNSDVDPSISITRQPPGWVGISGDLIAGFGWYNPNSAGTLTGFAGEYAEVNIATAGSETGEYVVQLLNAGSLAFHKFIGNSFYTGQLFASALPHNAGGSLYVCYDTATGALSYNASC